MNEKNEYDGKQHIFTVKKMVVERIVYPKKTVHKVDQIYIALPVSVFFHLWKKRQIRVAKQFGCKILQNIFFCRI